MLEEVLVMASNNIIPSARIKDTRPYILWRRVSTKTQGKSGLGLEAQLEIARVFTGRDPVRIYTDVYSGTKLSECQELEAAIAFREEHDLLLVIAKTDRFRNVREALEVLDRVGEGNLAFCDLPDVNRMILTIMFSVWESQALMGRINTRLAVQVRLETAKREGGWVSKTGKWRTKWGREKGTDTSKAVMAASVARTKVAEDWREESVGYKWVRRALIRGVPRKQIIEEFNANAELGIPGFTTSGGAKLSKGVLSKWAKEINNK